MALGAGSAFAQTERGAPWLPSPTIQALIIVAGGVKLYVFFGE
jgi:hypothetical protein